MPSLLPFVWLIMTPVFAADDPTHWFVGPNEIFDEIQPAIDAAAPGDIIWVEPTKDYASFTIYRKGVSIRTLGEPFRVDDLWPIQAVNIPFGERASISGVEIFSDSPGVHASLLVYESAGDVDLDRVSIDEGGRAAVIGSADVTVTRLVMEHTTPVKGCGHYCAVALLQVERSRIALGDCSLQVAPAPDGDFPELDGGPALELIDSRALIAGGNYRGGDGGDGEFQFSCINKACTARSGFGGPAMILRRSFVQILGTPSHRVQAGDAGEAGLCCWATDSYCLDYSCEDGEVTPGMAAILSDASLAEISGTEVLGGNGNPPGPPTDGEVLWIQPAYPYLEGFDPMLPGDSVEVTIHGEAGSTAFILISPGHDWNDWPSAPGPPLRIDPSRPFLTRLLGVIPQNGLITGQFVIPPRPNLSGKSPTLQGLLFEPDGTVTFSNSATQLLGPYQESRR
ncbi:MAG: hypothetical protein RL885_05810 [Planctomycetota bacterium]